MSRSIDDHRANTKGTHLRELRLRLSRSGLAALGVEELLSLRDECGSVRFRSLSCRGCSGTAMVEVDEPVETERFEALDYVHAFDLVGRGPDRLEYLLRMELPHCQETLDDQEGEFYVDGPLHVDDDRLTFTAVATQDALENLHLAFGGDEALGAHLEVLRIGEYSGHTDRVDALTERQRDVLTTAFERDYFAVPRGVTADDLAAEFELDKSTVLEHLRRAERNLLETTFERGHAEFTR
jgi:hypothetical protein